MGRLRKIGLIVPAFAAGTTALAAADDARPDAQPARDGYALSYNLYWVSDYRGRGVSYSGGEPALQGGADVSESTGWSAGVWASTFPEDVDADVEIDLYAAKAFAAGPAELAVGVAGYFFPGAENWDFGEVQASLSLTIGPVDATLASNYAWQQDNLGGEDNFYVTASVATPVGRFLGAPLTFSASIGHEEGVFAIEGAKLDWSFGLTADIGGIELGVSYVDTDIDAGAGDGGFVLTLGRTFG